MNLITDTYNTDTYTYNSYFEWTHRNYAVWIENLFVIV